LKIAKKFLSAATAAVTVLSLCSGQMFSERVHPLTVDAEEASQVILGDANGDGKLDVRDAAFIAYNLAMRIPIDLDTNPAADFNGDGKVTVADAAAITRQIAAELAEEIGGEAIERDSHSYAGISLGTVTTYPGETVRIPINITCNNNLESATFLIEWEDEVLTSDRAFSSVTMDATVASANGEGYCTAVLYGCDAIADGELAYIEFTVPEDAAGGTEYKLNVTKVETFAEFEGEDLADTVSVSGGLITVLPEPYFAYEIYVGEEFEFAEDFAVFEIISANTEIASFINNTLTGIKAGTTELSFILDNNEIYTSKVIVKSPIDIEIEVGEQQYIFTSEDLENVKWLSGDESIVTVENGVVMGVSEGTTTVSAISRDDGRYIYQGIVTVTKRAVTTADSDEEPVKTTATSIYTKEIISPITVEDYADEDMPTPSIYLSNISGMPGETVIMPIRVKCGDSLESCDVVLGWDDSNLTASPAVAYDYDTYKNTVLSEALDGAVTFVTYSVSGRITDGYIGYIEFAIPQDAVYGCTYNIDFDTIRVFYSVTDGDIIDTVETFGGTITVGSENYIDMYPGDKVVLTGNSNRYSDISVDNEDVAYVDDGVIYAVSSGTTEITFTNSEETVIYTVNVCTPYELKISKGEAAQIICPLAIKDNAVWLSDNTSSVTVDSDGNIWGLDYGKAVISVVDTKNGGTPYQVIVTVGIDETDTTTAATTKPNETTGTTVSTTAAVSDTEADTTGTTTASETTIDTTNTTATTVTTTTETGTTRPKGDANNDGKMTVSDAAFIARTLAKRLTIDALENPYADYNNDGKVTVADAAGIARELAKKK